MSCDTTWLALSTALTGVLLTVVNSNDCLIRNHLELNRVLTAVIWKRYLFRTFRVEWS